MIDPVQLDMETAEPEDLDQLIHKLDKLSA